MELDARDRLLNMSGFAVRKSFDGQDLELVDMAKRCFFASSFAGARLRDVYAHEARFFGCDLSGADCNNMRARNARFICCEPAASYKGADFRGATLVFTGRQRLWPRIMMDRGADLSLASRIIVEDETYAFLFFEGEGRDMTISKERLENVVPFPRMKEVA